jgi:tripartite-type tricarboxylate transporter receptor subunit TctC
MRRREFIAGMKLPNRRRVLHLAAGAAVLPALVRSARAQAYPARPVRIIVPFAPAGTTDIVARLMAQWLSERLGQQFVIENRPGGGGNPGIEAVVHAPADGYTLLSVNVTAAINATLFDKLSYNFLRDIAPVANMIRVANVMVVNPSFPAKTVPEFIAYAKANPGKISLASAGIGSSNHLFGELFKAMTGISLIHVPYRGGGPAIADLLGGQVNKCKISVCRSDQTLPISRRANAGAMRPPKCARDPRRAQRRRRDPRRSAALSSRGLGCSSTLGSPPSRPPADRAHIWGAHCTSVSTARN